MAEKHEIEAAIKLLNENDYLAIPITKGQMCLCDNCIEDENQCRFCAHGFLCSNLICINKFIKQQIDYKELISNIDE